MNHAKTFFIFSLLTLLFLCSCKSNDRTEIDRPAIEHSKQIERITNAVSDYGRYINESVQNLADQGQQLDGNLSELNNLLGEYFTTVGDLLHRYKQLQRFIESKGFYYREFEEGNHSVHSLDPSINNP